jgi:ABC-type lipoprotein release transport system permease subunit
MRRGLRPVWVGLLLGTAPGFLIARAVVPVAPDPRSYVLVPALLVVTSVIAIWRPTRRASGADPMAVLRED